MAGVKLTPGLGVERNRERLEHFRQASFASETWLWDQRRTFEAR
jgi:hypothetical protein